MLIVFGLFPWLQGNIFLGLKYVVLILDQSLDFVYRIFDFGF